MLGLESLDIYFQLRAVAWGRVGLTLVVLQCLESVSGMIMAYLVSREACRLVELGLGGVISAAVGLTRVYRACVEYHF